MDHLFLGATHKPRPFAILRALLSLLENNARTTPPPETSINPVISVFVVPQAPPRTPCRADCISRFHKRALARTRTYPPLSLSALCHLEQELRALEARDTAQNYPRISR